MIKLANLNSIDFTSAKLVRVVKHDTYAMVKFIRGQYKQIKKWVIISSKLVDCKLMHSLRKKN